LPHTTSEADGAPLSAGCWYVSPRQLPPHHARVTCTDRGGGVLLSRVSSSPIPLCCPVQAHSRQPRRLGWPCAGSRRQPLSGTYPTAGRVGSKYRALLTKGYPQCAPLPLPFWYCPCAKSWTVQEEATFPEACLSWTIQSAPSSNDLYLRSVTNVRCSCEHVLVNHTLYVSKMSTTFGARDATELAKNIELIAFEKPRPGGSVQR